MDDRGENMRRQRLEQARAIFRHEKFLAMPAEIKRKIMHELVLKGLALDELKVLLQEAEDAYGNVPQVAQDRKEESLRAYLQTLPYDVFLSIVTKGDIAGTDLIRLCNSSRVLNEYCYRSRDILGREESQYLFRRLLERMGRTVGPNDKPAEVYKYHVIRVPIIFNRISSRFKILRNFDNLIDHSLGYEGEDFYPLTLYDLLYELPGDGKLRGLLLPSFPVDDTYSGAVGTVKSNLRRHLFPADFWREGPSAEYLRWEEALRDLVKRAYPEGDDELISTIKFNAESIMSDTGTLWINIGKLKHVRAFLSELNELKLRDPAGYAHIIGGLAKHKNFKNLVSMLNTNNDETLIREGRHYYLVSQFKDALKDYLASSDIMNFSQEEMLFIISLHRQFLAGELSLSAPFTLSGLTQQKPK